jgi:hypothetical protein
MKLGKVIARDVAVVREALEGMKVSEEPGVLRVQNFLAVVPGQP